MRKSISGGLAAIVLVASTPAVSQIWIGQVVGNMMAAGQAARQEHECMMGTAMPVAEVDETRGYTAAAIRLPTPGIRLARSLIAMMQAEVPKT